MATSSSRIRLLVEIALVVALAAVLNSIKLWRMPQGGTFSLGMLPLFVLALRRGPIVGVAAGALYGVVDFFVDPYPPVHWIQFALDYPLAYSGVGLSGVLWTTVARARRAGSRSWTAWLLAAIAIGATARYAVHVASGVVFFAEYAQGRPVLAYSLGYNLYVLLSAAACYAAALAVLPMLPETETKPS